jgi:hypothetical protein
VRLVHAFEIAGAWEAVAASHDANEQVVTLRDRMDGRSEAGTATCKRERFVSAYAAPSAAHSL